MSFTESTGDLYYVGDDVAVAWDEASVLFTVDGDDGGVVEVRDIDRNFTFSLTTSICSMSRGSHLSATAGQRWASSTGLIGIATKVRFHAGPSIGNRYFCFGHDTDVPPALHLEDVWAQFFRALYWIGGNVSSGLRASTLRRFFSILMSLTSVQLLLRRCLKSWLTKMGMNVPSGLRAVFRDEMLQVNNFVSLLPTSPDQFDKAFFRAVWRGLAEGENKEVYYIGVERRNLKPFVQLPLQRTSKTFMEKFRAHFKGHRIDRQEYNL